MRAWTTQVCLSCRVLGRDGRIQVDELAGGKGEIEGNRLGAIEEIGGSRNGLTAVTLSVTDSTSGTLGAPGPEFQTE